MMKTARNAGVITTTEKFFSWIIVIMQGNPDESHRPPVAGNRIRLQFLRSACFGG
jgi:hypothetical protein